MHSLTAILKGIGIEVALPDIRCTGLSIDTRTLQAGEVFCACVGTKGDGSQYIAAAEQNGAVAILYDASLAIAETILPAIAVPNLSQQLSALADAFYQRPSQSMTVIGVTGTNGKTSVSQYFAQALDQLHTPCGILGTVGNGRWGHLQTASLTTPDAISVQKYLAQFRDQGLKAAAMEVSSHGLAQHRVAAVQFTVGVFTNLSQDHLDFHQTMDKYAEAKSQLFQQGNLQFAVINADDAYASIMSKAIAANTRILTYGIKQTADLRVSKLEALPYGYTLHFHSPWGEDEWTIPLLGLFNIYNVLAVIGGLGLLGYSLTDIKMAITQLQGAKGRMEVLRYPNKPTVIIDYAHTPDALEKALQAVRTHCPGRLWLVTGCGGNRDRSKRPIMAKIACEMADHVIITEDNNRYEAFTDIVDDMRAGFLSPDRVTIIPQRAEAIAYALQHAGPHDSVLLANKGHENYLDIAGVKYPFDERTVVKQIYGLS